jgi:hypothetical protein
MNEIDHAAKIKQRTKRRTQKLTSTLAAAPQVCPTAVQATNTPHRSGLDPADGILSELSHPWSWLTFLRKTRRRVRGQLRLRRLSLFERAGISEAFLADGE